jgi:YD repeat-containing protein
VEIDYTTPEEKYGYKRKCKYDDKGNETEWVSNRDDDGSQLEKMEMTYDDKGNKITEKNYNNENKLSSSTAYKYDDKGNMTEEDRINDENKVFRKMLYKYDPQGNPTEKLDLEGDKLKSKITYSYNDKGQKTKEDKYDGDGSLNYSMVYTYDKSGNMTGYSLNKPTDKKASAKTVKYESFDKKGNGQKTTIIENGKTTQFIDQEVTYY